MDAPENKIETLQDNLLYTTLHKPSFSFSHAWSLYIKALNESTTGPYYNENGSRVNNSYRMD